jgi:hypothetical protein
MAPALVDQSIHPKVFTDPQSQPLPAYLDSIRKMFEQAVLGAFSQSLIVHSSLEEIPGIALTALPKKPTQRPSSRRKSEPTGNGSSLPYGRLRTVESVTAAKLAHGCFKEGWSKCYETLAAVVQDYHGKLAKIASTRPELGAADPAAWASERTRELLSLQIHLGKYPSGEIRLPFVDRWFRQACDGLPHPDLIRAGYESGFVEPWCAPAFAEGGKRFERMSLNQTEALLGGERFFLDERMKWAIRDAEDEAHVELAMVERYEDPANQEMATGLSTRFQAKRVPQINRKGRPRIKLVAMRRRVIKNIAATGATGREYCKRLTEAGLSTPVHWQNEEGPCPKSYLEAYDHPDPKLRKKWRQRIANEKSQATRTATGPPSLALLANS